MGLKRLRHGESFSKVGSSSEFPAESSFPGPLICAGMTEKHAGFRAAPVQPKGTEKGDLVAFESLCVWRVDCPGIAPL